MEDIGIPFGKLVGKLFAIDFATSRFAYQNSRLRAALVSVDYRFLPEKQKKVHVPLQRQQRKMLLK